MKVIITGATGMVGEGVLLECLNNTAVSQVLSVSRKSSGISHPKMKELLVTDFTKMADYKNETTGYDACFFCAGISSVGMSEEKFTQITYTTTMAFAKSLLEANNHMTFIYVSGSSTDSTENGSVMWARVKGKTENDLAKLGFQKAFSFRPGGMLPYKGQMHARKSYVVIANILKFILPSKILSLSEVGQAMIHAVQRDDVKPILEIKDIKALAK
ncbi:MAG: NAD-dependent epimerase/dehydratase family protein [Sphingobacterium sp.]|jgi:uncharacterized protein YbjT (DUF2867 family)|nr:NAD-dependent epimerase/dehydratase family protein [Sphingobacterium sp.]